MDLSVWEKGATCHQIIWCVNLLNPFSIFVDDTKSISSHHPVTTWVISTIFGI